jgi:hypothetical protein
MFSSQDTLAKVDPELWSAVTAENRRQEDHIELIASENYVSHAVMEAQGSQLTNKYAEGYPGQALLRRMRICRHRRAARHRPGEGTLWRRGGQRAAQFGLAGQPGGADGLRQAGRHHHGHESGRGRSPDPRHAAQHVRQMVQCRRLRAERQGRDRLSGNGGARPRAQAPHHRRRRVGLLAAHRFRALRQDREGSRRNLLGRHGPLRRA